MASDERSEGRGATVEFRDIGISFGKFEAVRNFNLDVEAGEFITFLGPSGSGKTTVLNMVAGFLSPTTGDVLIDHRSIASLPSEKRNVGMVFQNYSLFPHMTVYQNVAFPLRMRHVPAKLVRERVEHALQLVHLEDYGHRMPNQLSGGQRQRVAFARAMVFDPKVLLMDEPLGALDLKLREHMQLEIKRYQEQIGCTVIYVTHDQSEALTLSDRIVIMNQGRIVQIGSPQEIYDEPKSRFVAEFVGETNVLSLEQSGSPTGQWRILELDLPLPSAPVVCGNGETPAFVSIRPEAIIRAETGAEIGDGLIAFEANVSETVFLGDYIKYIARLDRGGTISFNEDRRHSAGPLAPNERVRIGFSLEEVVVLPAD